MGGCEERKETIKTSELRGPKGPRGMELERGFLMIKQNSYPNEALKQTFDPQLIMFGETEAQKKTQLQR